MICVCVYIFSYLAEPRFGVESNRRYGLCVCVCVCVHVCMCVCVCVCVCVDSVLSPRLSVESNRP